MRQANPIPRFRTCFSEGFANLLASPLRNMAFVLIGFACILGGLLTALHSSQEAFNSYETRESAGGNFVRVVTKSESGISATRCDAASTISGVSRSGAVLSSGRTTVDGFPFSFVSVHVVTPGIVSLAFPEARTNVITDLNTADRFGVSESSGIRLSRDGTNELVTISEVSATSSRMSELNGSILIPRAPTTEFVAECYIEASYGNRAEVATVLLSWFGESSEVIAVPYDKMALEPRDTFRQQIAGFELWAPSAGAVLFVAFQVFGTWNRRRDFALYRTSGFTGLRLTTVFATEAALVILVGLALASATVAFVLALNPDPLSLAVVAGSSLQVLSLLTAGLGVQAAIIHGSSVVASVKES